jgi:hypothetical protein
MVAQTQAVEARVSISGRRLALPTGPVFELVRAASLDFTIGEFRAWAGYKNFGADRATDDLIHYQHVLTFAPTEQAGRTGVHVHLAHAHIIIPTSGRGVFSYDGVVTPAVPGDVIVQHGGTVHDQFQYSYSASSEADNRLTPLAIEPLGADAPTRSFSFLELFVPKIFANVEIVPPDQVSEDDQASAWDHPYHAQTEDFFIQHADASSAAYRSVAGRTDLEARDAGTWAATGGLVATWFIRTATSASRNAPPIDLDIAEEAGGIVILHMVAGEARFTGPGGAAFHMAAGDVLTQSPDLADGPFDSSSDMRMIRFFVSASVEALRQRTPEEIRRLEALGPAIVTRREVRAPGDCRPVNFLRGG